ncbi:MAG: CPBP family intramembrane metalloprotease [Pleurocapsa sp. SU_196_0]|nr:CPBP family intramembrane metalloprotease [Pleurocapsa sp. SU_196_0]
MVRPNIDVKLLLALPGVLMMLVGYVGCRLLNIPLRDASLEITIFATLTAFYGASALSSGFERWLPSFRSAGGSLEGAVRMMNLTPPWAFALSMTSAVGEELLFRGLLLGLGVKFLPVALAVVIQAALFAALHPAPRAAWAYPLWTGLIGAWFGVVTVLTGSVVPGMLAHYLFNHLNFNAFLESQASSP